MKAKIARGNELILEDDQGVAHLAMMFIRTLRVPDDGQVHPLPPGLGPLPIRAVTQYRDRVPKEWLSSPGLIIPMYQREAMWLSCLSEHGRPTAIRVASGQINAISGRPWSTQLSTGLQDYIVCPPQRWFDGFRTGQGEVRQFVAVPLGSRYTVEAQLTGKEDIGGIQIGIYPARPQPSVEPAPPTVDQPLLPASVPSSVSCAMLLYRDAQGLDVAVNLPPDEAFLGRGPACIVRTDDAMVSRKNSKISIFEGRWYVEDLNSANGTFVNDRKLRAKEILKHNDVIKCGSLQVRFVETASRDNFRAPGGNARPCPSPSLVEHGDMADGVRGYRPTEGILPAAQTRGAPDPGRLDRKELGLSAGGRIQEKIYPDPYGRHVWDGDRATWVWVHIVSIEDWQSITGEAPPPSPISRQSYAAAGYPWFEVFDGDMGDVPSQDVLASIRSMAELDKLNRIVDLEA